MTAHGSQGEELSVESYAAIAAFRFELRRFLCFSEKAAVAAGLPAQQHQALLAMAGYVGDEPPSVGHLADQLLIAPHTAAELVSRMVKAGLVAKAASSSDGRRATLTMTDKARALLATLTASHMEELKTLEPALARVLGRMSRLRSRSHEPHASS